MDLSKYLQEREAELFVFELKAEHLKKPLLVKCRPVNYIDTLESLGGKIDIGAFQEFQGTGESDEDIGKKLMENASEYIDTLKAGVKLQDLYLVKGIESTQLCFDGEVVEGATPVSKFKSIIIKDFGQETLDQLQAFIQKLSEVQQGKTKSN